MTNKKTATVRIALVVFPDDNNASFPTTTQMLEKWIKHNCRLKKPTEIKLKEKKGKKKKDAVPSLTKDKPPESQRSIYSILSAGSKKRASAFAAGPIAPFYDVPPEVCCLIWGYLSPPEIATAARVNRTWYNFCRSFLSSELGEAIVTGAIMNQSQDIDFVVKKKKKVTKETTFKLKTFVAHNDIWTQSESELSDYDFMFFLFESKVKEDNFKTLLELYNSFYQSKKYENECPAVILGTEEANSILDLKTTHKADFVNIEKDLNNACLASATILEREKVVQKIATSHPYRVRDFLTTLIVSLLIVTPIIVAGIGVLVATNGSHSVVVGISILSAAVFVCIAIQTIVVLTELHHRKKRNK